MKPSRNTPKRLSARPRCLIGWINSASGLDWHNRLVGDGPKVLSVFRETASTRCSR